MLSTLYSPNATAQFPKWYTFPATKGISKVPGINKMPLAQKRFLWSLTLTNKSLKVLRKRNNDFTWHPQTQTLKTSGTG